MKGKFISWLMLIAVLALSVAFVIKFGTPKLLRSYIQTGIGDCSKIPILCMNPQETQITFSIDSIYQQGLIPHEFPKTKIRIPRGFSAVQELIKQPYYKKRKPYSAEPVIYILHQPAGFFPKLFPQAKGMGIDNNFKFMRSLMYARESQINGLGDAFFVILKSIFTPDLGDQAQVKMIQFKFEERDYFLNYNLTGPANFFDCSIIAKNGEFFKVYIKDTRKELDLGKAFAIISTINGI